MEQARLERELAEAIPETPAEFASGDVEIQLQPRECTSCGKALDSSHLIGTCLLRCPNPDCGQLTYISTDELSAGVS